MNAEALDYWLKEAEIGIRIMCRDRSTLHVFDLGKTPDGIELSFVMMVMPKQAADALANLTPSKPITMPQ